MSALAMVLVTPAVRSNLHRLAYRYLRNNSLAELVVADSVSRALERIEQDRPRNFLAWLSSIARSLALRHLRSKVSRQVGLDDLSKKPPCSSRSAFAEAVTREALDLYDRMFIRLTDLQARVLRLRAEGTPFREIGFLLDLDTGAARAIAFRARVALRPWLRYMGRIPEGFSDRKPRVRRRKRGFQRIRRTRGGAV